MHVRVRLAGQPEAIVVVPSKLTKIEKFRELIQDKFDLEPSVQRLFYGGKLLENGYSFHDYNIKLNDVIQVMKKIAPPAETSTQVEDAKPQIKEEVTPPKVVYEDGVSTLYRVGDLIDARERSHHGWFEGKIVQIVKDPNYVKTDDDCKKTDSKIPDVNALKNDKSPKKTDPNLSDVNALKNDKSPKKTDNKNERLIEETDSKSSPVKENIPEEQTNGHCSKNSSPKNVKTPKSKNSTPKRGITHYFSKEIPKTDEVITDDKKNKDIEEKSLTKVVSMEVVDSESKDDLNEVGLLYRVQFDGEEDDDESSQYCKLSEIRPRSRKEIPVEDLLVNQTVMVNHNTEEAHEKGYWYDFTINEIKKNRKNTELYGTLYHGEEVPMHNVKVTLREKVFAIEAVIPLEKRTKEDEETMITNTEKRVLPVTCTKCKDNPDVSCKSCGCHICAGKNNPNLIILCDECNQGYHMSCLQPPLEKIPEDDWYCVDCKRDTNEVIAPGAKKQQRKPNQGHKGRDWGRGMACVGKTQTCAMPANHFGPIPGTEVGMMWRFRIQLSESGIHRPPVSGIHGRDVEGAYSIVLSGGYEDDYDNGYEFTYTGSGGRDLSGNKRTADQSSDQTLTRENKALARNCAVKTINEEGADSGEKWRDGKPVRVVRSYKMLKHFPQYAPKEGIRYDGIYKVVKYYPETGKSGFRVWKYQLRRDDPNPAPWEKGAKAYPLIYPDGYLEAEAEKQAQKDKQKMKNQKTPNGKPASRKRPLRESNGNDDSDDDGKTSDKKNKGRDSPPAKRIRTRASMGGEKLEEDAPKVTPKRKRLSKTADKIQSPTSTVNPFTIAAKKSKSFSNGESNKEVSEVLSKQDREAIAKDAVNKKVWDECLEALESDGKKGLVDKVTSLFLCIICQEVAANPVTTSCLHNFCMPCLKHAFKSTETNSCPYCRTNLSKEELTHNEDLKTSLRIVLPGYDANRK